MRRANLKFTVKAPDHFLATADVYGFDVDAYRHEPLFPMAGSAVSDYWALQIQPLTPVAMLELGANADDPRLRQSDGMAGWAFLSIALRHNADIYGPMPAMVYIGGVESVAGMARFMRNIWRGPDYSKPVGSEILTLIIERLPGTYED